MPSGSDNQRLLTEFTLTRRMIVVWTCLGTGMVFLALFVFGAIYAVATGRTGIGFRFDDGGSMVVSLGLILLLFVGVIVLHEAIHAVIINRYGGDVSFGVGLAGFVLPYAYVTTTHQFERNQFMMVALAPLIIITLIGVPLMIALDAAVLVIPLAANAGGAIGDLWMAGILLRYPSHVVVEDAVTGMNIYGRPDDDLHSSPMTRAFLKRIVLGTGVGFGLLLLVAPIAPVLLDMFGHGSFTLGVPDSPWYVYSFDRSPSAGFEANINPIGVIAASALLGSIYGLVATSRPPRT